MDIYNYSYVFTENSEFTSYIAMEDNLSAPYVFAEYVGNRYLAPSNWQLNRIRYKDDWSPVVVNGKPVSIRVEVWCDYESEIYGWRCYLLSPEEERVIPRQTEMLNE